jgi:SAM-dependent methyltransferase
MSTTTSTTSAERNGAAWGARARDWGDTEAQQVPTYEEAIRRAGIGRGQTVLDVGCGTGVFLRAAADHGATVCGIDASEALLEIARERVPDAELALGDVQHLPYADDRFDAVCGFNSFFYADDMVAALREAGRVAKPGAPVVIQVFGRPEHFDLRLMKEVLARFAPPPPERSGGEAAGRDRSQLNSFTLWEPGVLEGLAAEAGLVPERAFDLQWAYEYADEAELTRGMMSAGGFGAIVGGDRQDAARASIVDALAVCRTPDGSYRLDNEWHYLIARA